MKVRTSPPQTILMPHANHRQIHSYSFYCGHLSECLKKLRALDEKSGSETKEEAELRDTLAFELTSPSGRVTYPQNFSLHNFVDYMLCPTLCYELSYPRTDRYRHLRAQRFGLCSLV